MGKSKTITKERPPTEKQRMFTECYYTPGSESFGNGRESARRAGYKGNGNTLDQRATELVRNSKVIIEKNRIQAITAKKNDLTIKQVLSDLDWGINIAREKQDLSALARLSELRGKYLSMFSESGNNAATGLNLNFSVKPSNGLNKPRTIKIG